MLLLINQLCLSNSLRTSTGLEDVIIIFSLLLIFDESLLSKVFNKMIITLHVFSMSFVLVKSAYYQQGPRVRPNNNFSVV